MNSTVRTTRNLVAGAALLSLIAGCTIMQGDKVDYKSAQKGVSLEVPPDLTQLSGDSRYSVPGGSVSANAFEQGQAKAEAADSAANTAPSQIADVRFVRDGDQRWLQVSRPPEKIWNQVRDFWLDNGFVLAVDQPKIGIMETDWAENRAKIPQDIIRRTVGKLFDSLYSTGTRDRFRTRMERTQNGGTDIFIAQQGMKEVYTNAQKDSTVWEPSPNDPGLEAEFLKKLMVKLGATEQQAQAAVAQQNAAAEQATPRAQLITAAGVPAVQVDEGFDRAWLRVGLALDRTGFTVEDRDRSKGLYFVRYVEPTAEKKEPGFFSKLFGGASKALPTEQYQIHVASQGTATLVTVQKRDGTPAAAADAQRITKVLADDLK